MYVSVLLQFSLELQHRSMKKKERKKKKKNVHESQGKKLLSGFGFIIYNLCLLGSRVISFIVDVAIVCK